MTNLDSILKSRDITLPTKVHLVKAMVFPAVMHGCELDCEESWAPKNWCFWTVVLERTLESPLDCKEIQSVHSKGDQSWVLFGRTDAEAETPILWPPAAKNWLTGKDPDSGKDWRHVEKRMTEDEMVGWHHRLSGREFECTPGVGDGQRQWTPGVLWFMGSHRVGHDWSNLAAAANIISKLEMIYPYRMIICKYYTILCKGLDILPRVLKPIWTPTPNTKDDYIN